MNTLTEAEREAYREILEGWAHDLQKTGCFQSVIACKGRWDGEPASGYYPSTERLLEKAGQ